VVGGRGGEWLEYLDVALAIKDAGLVNGGDTWDGRGACCGIIVDNALVGAFELQDHWVCRERLEVWVELLRIC
jgi:hypothetical protein